MIILAVLSTLAIGAGLLSMPFGYYTLLRATLCLSGCVGIAAARRQNVPGWTWAYAVISVLYNPVLPVHLGSKGMWVTLNLVTLIVLWVGALRFRGALKAG